MSPEFYAGLILLFIGTWVCAFPRDGNTDQDY
jgi:hypothetical protein